MVILEDTRQQAGKHNLKAKFFEENGIVVQRSKLYVGDYTLANNGNIAIDTKKDVMELFGNLTFQHERFKTEILKAQEAGIKLYILVEEEIPKTGLQDWVSPVWSRTGKGHVAGQPMTKYNPATAAKTISTMTAKYGVEFIFINPADSGKKILELLGVNE